MHTAKKLSVQPDMLDTTETETETKTDLANVSSAAVVINEDDDDHNHHHHHHHHELELRYVDLSCHCERLSKNCPSSACRPVDAFDERGRPSPAMVSSETFGRPRTMSPTKLSSETLDESGILTPPLAVSLGASVETEKLQTAMVSSEETITIQTGMVSLEESRALQTGRVSVVDPGMPQVSVISLEVFDEAGISSAMIALKDSDEVPGTPGTFYNGSGSPTAMVSSNVIVNIATEVRETSQKTMASPESFEEEPGTPTVMVSLEAINNVSGTVRTAMDFSKSFAEVVSSGEIDIQGTKPPWMVSVDVFAGSMASLETVNDEQPGTPPSAMVTFKAFNGEPGTPPQAMFCLGDSPPPPMAPKKSSKNRIIPLGKQRPRKLSFDEETNRDERRELQQSKP